MDHLQAVNTLAAERYLLDEMTDAERDEFEGHFFSCRDCAEDLRDGAIMVDGARSGLIGSVARAAAPPKLPSPFIARPRWRPSVMLPWAAAASFALATGYLALQIPRPGPLVLTPATLRPATRGQEAIVSPGAGGIRHPRGGPERSRIHRPAPVRTAAGGRLRPRIRRCHGSPSGGAVAAVDSLEPPRAGRSLHSARARFWLRGLDGRGLPF